MGFIEENHASSCSEAEMSQVIEAMPQKPPFLFLDRIVELSDEHIVAQRRFRPDEHFYQGHFPGDPVTPGVILIEVMAQAACVALGIYLLRNDPERTKLISLFSDCTIEFLDVVRPGDLVTVRGEKIFWRRRKLRSRVEMTREDGKLVASGTVSGFGVLRA